MLRVELVQINWVKRPNFPKICGFEFCPEGRLLNQFVEFEHPIGVAYERCIGYGKPPHTHDRFTITFPRGASRSSLHVLADHQNELFKLDETWVHLMPVDMLHEQNSYSTVYDTFALFPTRDVLEEVLTRVGASPAAREKFYSRAQKLNRTPLIDDLVSRYFFSRVMTAGYPSAESELLEKEILHLVVATATQAKVPETPIAPPSSIGIARALEYIESHLFEPLDVTTLTSHSRLSQATLFRQFRQEVKQAPLTYIRLRRLDEAMQLLKTGRYRVSDVAVLVCYEDLSSFSKSFKNHFGQSPSEFLPSAAAASN